MKKVLHHCKVNFVTDGTIDMDSSHWKRIGSNSVMEMITDEVRAQK